MPNPTIDAIFTGHPRSITDDCGTWVSSIFRNRADGPVPVTASGFAGDRVAQPYHGGPGAAICVHLADHYAFWNAHYGMALEAGSVGENVTLGGMAEEGVCVGDRVRVGTATVQVSGPRVPCANLARRTGRPDWVRLTILENRTGFYLRVLHPGMVQAGDPWILEKRLNPAGSISAINRCMYLDFDPAFALTMLEMQGLETWWKDQARRKIDDRTGHWTSTLRD